MRVERREERASRRLAADGQPRVLAVEHAHPERRRPARRLERVGREEMDVDVDDHGGSDHLAAANVRAAASAAATMFL